MKALYGLGLTFLFFCVMLVRNAAFGQVPGVPDISANDFWSAARAAGWFGTIMMTIMWGLERRERIEERKTGDKRHEALMDLLQTIKNFMELIKDRFPRTP